MREIKFRGKREDNGDWVYGSFIPDALEGSNSDLVSWGFIRRYNRGIGKMETIEVDRETVGQFTGLHDKNGVEIYEGDVVQETVSGQAMWDDDAICIQPVTGKVYWNYSGWEVTGITAGKAKLINKTQLGNAGEIIEFSLSKYDGEYYGWKTCEVIGNIHDKAGDELSNFVPVEFDPMLGQSESED